MLDREWLVPEHWVTLLNYSGHPCFLMNQPKSHILNLQPFYYWIKECYRSSANIPSPGLLISVTFFVSVLKVQTQFVPSRIIPVVAQHEVWVWDNSSSIELLG
jgi:hypothetical protein